MDPGRKALQGGILRSASDYPALDVSTDILAKGKLTRRHLIDGANEIHAAEVEPHSIIHSLVWLLGQLRSLFISDRFALSGFA
jgi:hypothetical protein